MTDMSRQGFLLKTDAEWWRDYYGVTRCSRCARTEGLRLGLDNGTYRLVSCDCNYVHVRASQRVAPALRGLQTAVSLEGLT